MMSSPSMEALAAGIARDGFAHVHAPQMRALLDEHGGTADWAAFAASWDDLGLDTYMADGGRYRKRRHAAFAMMPRTDGLDRRKPHQPHYQSRDYNTLNGGVERWFEPVLPGSALGPTMQRHPAHLPRAVRRPDARDGPSGTSRCTSSASRPGRASAAADARRHAPGRRRSSAGAAGPPRERRAAARPAIHASPAQLGSFTLTEPLDAALVDDHRVFHGVTPVEPVDPAQPGLPRRAGGDVPAGVGGRAGHDCPGGTCTARCTS